MRSGTEAVRSSGGASIEIRWRGARSSVLPLYAGLFGAVLVVLASGQGAFGDVHRTLMAFAVLPISYFVLVHLANSTTLKVVDGVLTVRHGPLPWRGRVVVPVAEVARLFFDPDNARLLLFTRRGEEVTLLDDMLRDRARAIDALLAHALASTAKGEEAS